MVRRRAFVVIVVALAACGTADHPPLLEAPGNTGQVMGGAPFVAGASAGSPTSINVGSESGRGATSRPVVVLADNQTSPQAMASDGTFLYFTTAGTSPSASDGSLARVTLGRQDVVSLATGLASPGPILLTGGALYWANRGNAQAQTATGSIAMLPFGGALQTLVSREIGPASLAANATRLFWTSNAFGNGTSVEQVPLQGGRSSVLTTFSSPFLPGGVAIDETYVYFLAHAEGQGSLFRSSLAGETPEVLWMSDAGEPVDLALDGTILYWVIDDAPPDGAVLAMPINGTQPKRIAPAQDHPVRLAVRDGTVYFVTNPKSGNGQLLEVPAAGGSPPQVILSGLDQPAGIQVADQIHVATRTQVLEIAK